MKNRPLDLEINPVVSSSDFLKGYFSRFQTFKMKAKKRERGKIRAGGVEGRKLIITEKN